MLILQHEVDIILMTIVVRDAMHVGGIESCNRLSGEELELLKM